MKTQTTLQEIRIQEYRNWVGQRKPEQIKEQHLNDNHTFLAETL